MGSSWARAKVWQEEDSCPGRALFPATVADAATVGKDFLFVAKNTARALSQRVRENTGVSCSHQHRNLWAFPLKKQMNITANRRHRPPSPPPRAPVGACWRMARSMFIFLHAPLARELSLHGGVGVLLNWELHRSLSWYRVVRPWSGPQDVPLNEAPGFSFLVLGMEPSPRGSNSVL